MEENTQHLQENFERFINDYKSISKKEITELITWHNNMMKDNYENCLCGLNHIKNAQKYFIEYYSLDS